MELPPDLEVRDVPSRDAARMRVEEEPVRTAGIAGPAARDGSARQRFEEYRDQATISTTSHDRRRILRSHLRVTEPRGDGAREGPHRARRPGVSHRKIPFHASSFGRSDLRDATTCLRLDPPGARGIGGARYAALR